MVLHVWHAAKCISLAGSHLLTFPLLITLSTLALNILLDFPKTALSVVVPVLLQRLIDRLGIIILKGVESRYNAIRGHMPDKLSAKISEPLHIVYLLSGDENA